MEAEFIQSCLSESDLLRHYANREYDWQKAGDKIKRAIAKAGFIGYYPFTFKNLKNKNCFTVQRMRYENELYAVVTNSAINYIFKIYL